MSHYMVETDADLERLHIRGFPTLRSGGIVRLTTAACRSAASCMFLIGAKFATGSGCGECGAIGFRILNISCSIPPGALIVCCLRICFLRLVD